MSQAAKARAEALLESMTERVTVVFTDGSVEEFTCSHEYRDGIAPDTMFLDVVNSQGELESIFLAHVKKIVTIGFDWEKIGQQALDAEHEAALREDRERRRGRI